MLVDLDTFVVGVYTVVDELYQTQIAPGKPVRRGHRPEMADSEVLTLLLLGQLLGTPEHGLLRHAATYWRAYFPRLLSQSAFNRRARELGGSDRHFYYGGQLLLATTADEVITGFLLGPANTEGRWLLDALLCWRSDPAAVHTAHRA